MDLNEREWENRYYKMREISKERKHNRDTHGRKTCCNDGDIRMIVTHGYWSESDHFSLPKGYKVIMLCQPGKTINLNKKTLDELRNLYKNGNTFFKDNDSNPEELTEEAIRWFDGVRCPCQARLYIGGNIDIVGTPVNTQVPNINLEFGGIGMYSGYCDNWSGEAHPTIERSTECKISCIKPANETNNGKILTCDKYYFDKMEGEDARRSINLKNLLENEGPGTYIIISCMEDELSPEQLKKIDWMRTMQMKSHPQSAKYDEDDKKWFPSHPVMTRSAATQIRDTAKKFTKAAIIKKQKNIQSKILSILRARLKKGGKKTKKKTKKIKKKTKKTKKKTKKTKKIKTQKNKREYKRE